MVSVQYANNIKIKKLAMINIETSINITNAVLCNYRVWKNFMPPINTRH